MARQKLPQAAPLFPALAPGYPENDPPGLRGRRAAALLAHGILQQYRWCKHGAVVGRSGDGTPGTGLPMPLRQAQGQLARLALEEGRFDTFSSVHELLLRCQLPLRQWAPAAIADQAELADLVLIDPDYRVPSADCELLAQTQSGSHADLVEVQLFEELQAALLEYPDQGSGDQAYTLLRQFIAEHPMATKEELFDQYRNSYLNDASTALLSRAYEPAHAAEARQHLVPRCAHCRARISVETGECTLVSCRYFHPVTCIAEQQVPLAEAYLARPELLRYWADPAQEELRLYQALCAVHGPEKVKLYPHRDRCDVALGEAWGVDVKDHQSPQRLAQLLNDNLGGLQQYPRGQRILAVATRRAKQPHYIKHLKQALNPAVLAQVEVLSVDTTIKKLKKVPHDTF